MHSAAASDSATVLMPSPRAATWLLCAQKARYYLQSCCMTRNDGALPCRALRSRQ